MVDFSVRPHPVLGSILAAAVLVMAPSIAAAQLTIDDFSTNQPSLVLTFPPAGTSASSSVSGAGMLGGERDMALNLTAGVIAGNTITSVVSSGFYSYSQDATIAGSGVLSWDGTDGSATLNPTGLGGVDLKQGGTQDALLLSIFFDDLPVNLTLDVMTDAGNASTVTLPLPGLIFSATTYVIPYSAFSIASGTGADFANVGAIRMTVGSAVTAPDLVIDLIQTTSTLNATMTVSPNSGVAPGSVVHYTAVVSNPDDAADASVASVVFDNSAITNAAIVVGSVTTSQGTVTTGNTAGDNAVSVAIGTITDASSVTIGFDAKVDNPLPGGVTQIASQGTVTHPNLLIGVLTDDTAVGGAADPTVATITAAPALSATESVALQVDVNTNSQINAGDTVRYTVSITNSGNQAATTVVFTNPVDPNADLIVGSVVTTSGAVTLGNTAGDTSVAVNIGNLAGAGGTVQIHFDVKLRDPFPAATVSSQGLVTAANAPNLSTDDPSVLGVGNPTVAAVVAVVSVVAVPTLGTVGLLLLSALLALGGAARLRRRAQ